MSEFSIIENYFQGRSFQRRDVALGIGDDCAITDIPEGQSLAVTTDTLVNGIHFPESTPPILVAQKAVAVNLSDLAAMGAEPAWLSLSLSIPEHDEQWLHEFSLGIQQMSEYYSVQLIGGDTVKGPLSITITAHGFIPKDQALTRSRAKPGDLLYVSGSLGDAALGLDICKGLVHAHPSHKNFALDRLNNPSPRVLVGTMLRRIASSCIDVSDGMLSDLKHILYASQCGALVHVDKLPLSHAMTQTVSAEQAYQYALNGGDDYELLFTVPESLKGQLELALVNANVSATCIGQIAGLNEKLRLTLDGEAYTTEINGYDHFEEECSE